MTSARVPKTPIGWFFKLHHEHPADFVESPRTESAAHPWPDGFDPRRAPVFAHNERVIPGATPDEVFDALIAADTWQKHYENGRDVAVDGSSSELTAQARFQFTTFATRQDCRVKEFEPGRALAWEARIPGNEAYHRWLLEPVKDGTLVVTEEINRGPLAHLNPVMSRALHASHARWLEGLEAQVRDQRSAATLPNASSMPGQPPGPSTPSRSAAAVSPKRSK